MAKQFYDSVIINGPTNQSGLQLAKMPAGSPALAGAPIGVDTSGNVVPLSPFSPAVLLTDVVGAAAADYTVLSTNLVANALYQGLIIESFASGKFTLGLLGGTLTFWVKIGSTKIISVPISASLSLGATYFWKFQAELTIRSVGTSGVVKCQGLVIAPNGTSTYDGGNDALINVDTTQAQAVSFGFTWSASLTGNSATASQAILKTL